MPTKQTTAPRGRPSNSKATARASTSTSKPRKAARSPNPFESSDSEQQVDEDVEVVDDEEEEPEATIPPELLTRLLHEFFEKDATRLTKDANGAAAKYMDIFVREAIARCVQEREGGFLEVEDLEKIAPQLLMDF